MTLIDRNYTEANKIGSDAIGRSWPAKLELEYSFKAERTSVRRRHQGPLLTQRPFYPEKDGTCHSYVLHPPGGVAGGDSLDLSVTVNERARCLLTAPGATKVYRSPQGGSRQRTKIDIGPGAVCEMLPMEIIIFNGARACFETEVRLQEDSIFFGWDIVSLGRPAADETFDDGRFEQRTTVFRNDQPIWFERACIDGGSPILSASYGFNGAPIFGTAIYAGPLPEDGLDRVRQEIGDVSRGLCSISLVGDVVACRYIGSKVAEGRGFFVRAWNSLRKLGQGKPAVAPRIWAT